jgi:hypothetical protein
MVKMKQKPELLIALLVLIICITVFQPVSAAVENLDFTWSMKDRFGELNPDGTVNYHYDPYSETYDQSYVNPEYYFVDVDATGVTGNTEHYRWTVDDGIPLEVMSPVTTLWIDELGMHDLSLTVWDADNPNDPVTITKTIDVKDWLIVSIGESYASGEGNPDIPGMCTIGHACVTGYKWQDQRCHRSASAGAAQAAMELEAADPHSSITYLSFACTGSKIPVGVIGPYIGGEAPLCQNPPCAYIDLPPQTWQIAQTLCPSADPNDPLCKDENARSIDMLLVSIGGNDVYFGEIVENALLPGDVTTDTELLEKISTALDALNTPDGGLYAQMNADIDKRFNVDRIFITEYPDPTTSETGEYCHNWVTLNPFFPLGGDATDVLMSFFNENEAEWAQQTLIKSLNNAVKAGADANGWQYIDGIDEGYYLHGYCSDQQWFRRLSESFYYQGDMIGTMHPNQAGHYWGYRPKILDALSPIILNQPPVADAGGPYTMNEGDYFYLDGTGSMDPDGTIESYAWDLDDDGEFDDGYGDKIVISRPDDYTGTIQLRVTDSIGASDIDTTTMTILNVPPSITVGNILTDEGETVNLLYEITDPGADTHTLLWDFGDGTAPGSAPHAYGDDGAYTAGVTVTDDDGGVGTASFTVTVNNAAPEVSPIAMTQPNLHFILPAVHELQFDADFTDHGWLDTHTGEWNFGDGTVTSASITEENDTPDATGSTTLTHTYQTSGDFTVTLTITDDTESSISTIPVHVADAGEVQEYLDSYIQNLPDSAFKGKADQNKNALANMFNALNDMLADEEYNGMIQYLQSNIRAKADGSMGGKPGDDWIKDPDAQREICTMIDDFINYLETLM